MRIVIATGGTGGHIFPALQTAYVLREREHEVIFVGSLGLVEPRVQSQGFKTIVIKAQGFTKRSLIGLFQLGLVTMGAIGQARGVLAELKPDKVIGFGGYGSFPVVLSAKFLNIPTMIHEQNVVPGKANRLLAKLVKKIAISFPETKDYLNTQKTIWTGCPCHQRKLLDTKEVLLKKFSLDPACPTVLVLGGSQGSQKINEVFFDMISSWDGKMPIQAIHMTGRKEFSLYKEKYQQRHLPVKVFEFIDPIEEAYAVSNIVIARAGAATVSELGFFTITSILIPYPLADGHQKYNAQVLVQIGLAKIIEQKDLNSGVLKNALESFLVSNSNNPSAQYSTKEFFKDNPAYELALAIENL